MSSWIELVECKEEKTRSLFSVLIIAISESWGSHIEIDIDNEIEVQNSIRIQIKQEETE